MLNERVSAPVVEEIYVLEHSPVEGNTDTLDNEEETAPPIEEDMMEGCNNYSSKKTRKEDEEMDLGTKEV